MVTNQCTLYMYTFLTFEHFLCSHKTRLFEKTIDMLQLQILARKHLSCFTCTCMCSTDLKLSFIVKTAPDC